MSDLSDSLEHLEHKSTVSSLSDKYKVMLRRNCSIVKDTLSKIWKLSHILRLNILQTPNIEGEEEEGKRSVPYEFPRIKVMESGVMVEEVE